MALFAAADPDAAASLGNAYVPSEEIERFLDIMGRRGTRAVGGGHALAGARPLGQPADSAPGGALARALVEARRRARGARAAVLPAGDESQPVRAQIDRALIGVSSTQWRGTRDRDVAILSAAQPIFVGDDIVGAAVVEETTGSIQILKAGGAREPARRDARGRGGRARDPARVRERGSPRASAACTPKPTRPSTRRGACAAPSAPSDARDEIGDLSRTTAAVLARLRDYNAYLEAMAGRLSHELRTPVAVVRSSLDNLKAQALPEEARVYVERAGEGVERLARLISRLSEGTRLERMLESAERERFDLAEVVARLRRGLSRGLPGARASSTRAPAGALPVHGRARRHSRSCSTSWWRTPTTSRRPGTAVRVSLAVRGGTGDPRGRERRPAAARGAW